MPTLKAASQLQPVISRATACCGTLVVVYGFFMSPTGWSLALLVWAYTLVSFFVASAVKIGVYHMIAHRPGRQARHLARAEGWLFNHFHHIWASKGAGR